MAEPRPRRVLHVDMDAFFASVEVLDHPGLKGLPVVVGGTGPRGVVASCSYEARAFGVRSAMPMARARRLCGAAVVVGGRYSRYEQVSGELRTVLRSVSPSVERIGLDEAFVDVTGAVRGFAGPEELGAEVRRRVLEAVSLECSVGIGRSKLIAKLASRAAKPRIDRGAVRPGAGVVVVPSEGELEFLHPQPVEALWGVGPATARRLHELGVQTVGDLAALPSATLVRRFGRSHGTQLAELARAHDPSPVVPDRVAKSVGHEETFPRDVHDGDELERHAVRLSDGVASQLGSSGLEGRTVTLKVRFGDFSLLTRSHTLSVALDAGPAIGAVAVALLDGIDVSPGVRLLGVSVGALRSRSTAHQLAFDLDDAAGAERLQAQWHEVTGAVERIRERFGASAVGPASSIGPDGLVTKVRGASQWGPANET